MTPYYDDGSCVLYNARAEDILPTLQDIDLVFTSPPYNLGRSAGSGFHAGSLAASDFGDGYDTYDDALSQDEYDRWQTEIVHALWGTLSDSGALFYNHKPRVQNGVLRLPTDFGKDLPLRQIIVWDRGTGLNFSNSFFLPKSEWVIVWARAGFTLRSKTAGSIGDVWRIPPETRSDHPAPFPLALPMTAIAATDAAVVLDPFAGIGTTLRAAKDLGRKTIGIEMSERYCEIAARRLSQEVLPFG